jgi:hypothetical protein
VEALGLHETIKLLDHEWVIDRSYQLDMAVMTWAEVAR